MKLSNSSPTLSKNYLHFIILYLFYNALGLSFSQLSSILQIYFLETIREWTKYYEYENNLFLLRQVNIYNLRKQSLPQAKCYRALYFINTKPVLEQHTLNKSFKDANIFISSWVYSWGIRGSTLSQKNLLL